MTESRTAENAALAVARKALGVVRHVLPNAEAAAEAFRHFHAAAKEEIARVLAAQRADTTRKE